MNIISIYRGDDDQRLITFTVKATGVAIDITGWEIFFTVKKDKDDIDDDALIAKSWTSHTSPSEGQTTLTLTATDTTLDPGIYTCDFQIKKVDGAIKTIVVMPFEIFIDITRRTT